MTHIIDMLHRRYKGGIDRMCIDGNVHKSY